MLRRAGSVYFFEQTHHTLQLGLVGLGREQSKDLSPHTIRHRSVLFRDFHMHDRNVVLADLFVKPLYYCSAPGSFFSRQNTHWYLLNNGGVCREKQRRGKALFQIVGARRGFRTVCIGGQSPRRNPFLHSIQTALLGVIRGLYRSLRWSVGGDRRDRMICGELLNERKKLLFALGRDFMIFHDLLFDLNDTRRGHIGIDLQGFVSSFNFDRIEVF
mmetsp:Transcript_54466/g.95151  ORF Transcript_54466/g.95151 Transcript_54466/m.95151 type:complete len:215 (-) Transcript_54466:887-1531(-)